MPQGLCENTTDETDLRGMKENDILLHFVRPDKSLSLSSEESEKKKLVKSFQGVAKLFGTDLPARDRFASELTYENMMSRIEIIEDEAAG